MENLQFSEICELLGKKAEKQISAKTHKYSITTIMIPMAGNYKNIRGFISIMSYFALKIKTLFH